MQSLLQNHLRTRIVTRQITPWKEIGWGMIGGLAATLVMDLVLMGILTAAGLPPFTCFSIVGDTVMTLLSLQGILASGSIPLGMAAHYVVGPVMGGIFGLAVAKLYALHVNALKKGVVFAVIYAEILSQPMLALTPILLRMTASETLQWYGGSFGMHLIWGCVLGVVVGCGAQLPIASKHRR